MVFGMFRHHYLMVPVVTRAGNLSRQWSFVILSNSADVSSTVWNASRPYGRTDRPPWKKMVENNIGNEINYIVSDKISVSSNDHVTIQFKTVV